jgi:putative hydrolase of the HAD superfamily
MGGAQDLKYDAIIFDLYGTLVGEWMGSVWDDNLVEQAQILGVAPDDFRRVWHETALDRQLGLIQLDANMRLACRELATEVSDEAIAAALAHRHAMYAEYFVPCEGAEETLAELKRRGYPLALISMCAPDTPEFWHASSLAPHIDVLVFSSESGLRKPHPEIYLKATGELGVEPARCLYVGDGAYNELTGAASLGMDAVLIRYSNEPDDSVLRPEAEQNWPGKRISSIPEVLDLLG